MTTPWGIRSSVGVAVMARPTEDKYSNQAVEAFEEPLPPEEIHAKRGAAMLEQGR